MISENLGRVAAQTNEGLPKLFSKLESMSVEQTRISSSVVSQTDTLQQVGDGQRKLQTSFDDNTQQIVSKLDEADKRDRSLSHAMTSLTQNWAKVLAT